MSIEEELKISAMQRFLHSKEHVFRSLVPCNLATCTKKNIKQYFENSYNLDEALFSAIISEEYFYKCPDRLRLPLIFYLAHPATLYVNKLLLAGLIEERINMEFETIFETGVDEMSWDDIENYRLGGSYKWPSFEDVMKYRLSVRDMVINVIEISPLTLPITQDHQWWSIFMGMEHERIHLETSSVLIRQLPVEYLKQPTNWKYAPLTADTPAGPNEFIPVENETEVNLGKPQKFPTYGWDNEYGSKIMRVPPFEATKYLITNAEFKEFVEDGGYENEELWSKEGWRWAQFRQVKHPVFWVCHRNCKSNCGADLATYSHCTLPTSAGLNGQTVYKYRAMFDVINMPWEWPVDVNYHEAKAYCRWKGPEYRLPTEAEHHSMRGEEPPVLRIECDPGCHEDYSANINMQYGSSTPVNFYPPTSRGFYDVYGNVWEWIEDHFNGFPNFKTNYLYDDFSTPCFDGRHNMIQGGSWISTGDEASRFARFSFRRHFFQHLGFRMVRSLSTAHPVPVNLCECIVFTPGAGVVDNPVTLTNVSNESLVPTTNTQYHYDSESICQSLITNEMGKNVNYGLPLSEYCYKMVSTLKLKNNKAMVAGCGPGYTSLLLGNLFNSVLGIDYSGRLVDVAMQFQSGQQSAVCGNMTINLPLSSECISTNNVTFKQLTWFPNELQGYDLILFEFLERLMEPKGWLYKLRECITDDGLLVICTSSKWTTGTLEVHIGQWFKLIDDTTICGRAVSSWQLKSNIAN